MAKAIFCCIGCLGESRVTQNHLKVRKKPKFFCQKSVCFSRRRFKFKKAHFISWCSSRRVYKYEVTCFANLARFENFRKIEMTKFVFFFFCYYCFANPKIAKNEDYNQTLLIANAYLLARFANIHVPVCKSGSARIEFLVWLAKLIRKFCVCECSRQR